MKISVITPTRNRESRLRAMYACFCAQSWPERELLILDDSSAPSPFFSTINDPRVMYRHSLQPIVLGEKRNQLVSEARGELVAHFDDDDLYGPDYLTRMVQLRGEADLFTLSGWFSYVEQGGAFWYWDTERVLPYRYAVSGREVVPQQRPPTINTKERRVDLDLWGYGFSYLYTKAAWARAPFAPVKFGEDHAFATRLGELGCARAYAPDHEGLALHILHGANSSRIFPQYALPAFAAHALFGTWLSPLLNSAR